MILLLLACLAQLEGDTVKRSGLVQPLGPDGTAQPAQSLLVSVFGIPGSDLGGYSSGKDEANPIIGDALLHCITVVLLCRVNGDVVGLLRARVVTVK